MLEVQAEEQRKLQADQFKKDQEMEMIKREKDRQRQLEQKKRDEEMRVKQEQFQKQTLKLQVCLPSISD